MKRIFLLIVWASLYAVGYTQNSPCNDGQIVINGNAIDAVSMDNSNATGFKLPMWLPAGTTIAPGARVYAINALEFNENVVNGTRQLEYNRTVLVTNNQTVPTGKTWKIESVLKLTNPFSGTISVTNNGPFCSTGGNLQLTATNVTGATYSWTGPNGFTSTLQNPTISNVTGANAGTYSLIIAANNCTTSAYTTQVVVGSNPIATFTYAPATVFVGNSVTFTPTASGLSYTWRFQGGTPATSSAAAPVVSFASSGNKAVTLIVNDNGCIDSSTQTINVQTCPSGSQTFSFNGGSQSFTVPSCVTQITIEAWGAQGGNGINAATGGLGGYAKGTMSVTPGQTLIVNVGGQNGFNGGGAGGFGAATGGISGNAGSGGGASDVRVGAGTLTDRVLVAAGGGGGGNSYYNGGYCCGSGGNGAAGGGTTGSVGSAGTSSSPGQGGAGGSATSGGSGGTGPGANGAAGTAGSGGTGANGAYLVAGGGGGGGWYGGGGGGAASSGSGGGGGGGGGGSSYTGTLTNPTVTPGLRSGNGQVLITW